MTPAKIRQKSIIVQTCGTRIPSDPAFGCCSTFFIFLFYLLVGYAKRLGVLHENVFVDDAALHDEQQIMPVIFKKFDIIKWVVFDYEDVRKLALF